MYEIDRVTADIRAVLAEETQALMDDIEYLQVRTILLDVLAFAGVACVACCSAESVCACSLMRAVSAVAQSPLSITPNAIGSPLPVPLPLLQMCLEETADERDEVVALSSRPAEPSVAELRCLESKLQKEVLKRVCALVLLGLHAKGYVLGTPGSVVRGCCLRQQNAVGLASLLAVSSVPSGSNAVVCICLRDGQDAAQEMARVLSKGPSAPTLPPAAAVLPSSSSTHTLPRGTSSTMSTASLRGPGLPMHVSPKKPSEPPPVRAIVATGSENTSPTCALAGGLSRFRGTVQARQPVFSDSDFSGGLSVMGSTLPLPRPKSRAQRLRDEISMTRDDSGSDVATAGASGLWKTTSNLM